MATLATMTAEQFDALPYEEGRRWELLEGDAIEVSSSTPEHQDIVFNLLAALKQFLRACGGGRAHRVLDSATREREPRLGLFVRLDEPQAANGAAENP